MKLYTRTGDAGETSLHDGRRVSKDDPRVVVCGEVDELNAMLGWCRAAAGAHPLEDRLETVQRLLFNLGAEVATPARTPASGRIPLIAESHVRQLETWIDEATAAVSPLKHFVLPAGCEIACRLHLARTACRRAERALVRLVRSGEVRPQPLVFLNRLGDALFAWAREANHDANHAETVWIPSP
jgi:cob(I)alamin adenosyltransferase